MPVKLTATFILAATLTTGATMITGATARHIADPDVDRVRTHLAAVEAELRAADVSALTPAQRNARARHVAVLREYREAGVFPHNHVAPGQRTAVFVDEHGTHCAVGYLLARDGRHDLVETIRSRRNTATVHELADEPQLVAWLDEAGLTLDEAARIQPRYGYDPAESRSDTDYATATVAGAAVSGGVIAWNLLRDDVDARTLPGVLGLGVGIAEIGLAAYGVAVSGNRNIDETQVAINLGIGVITSLFGARTLLFGGPPEPQPRTETGMRQSTQWRLSPWIPSRDAGAGMRLVVRF